MTVSRRDPSPEQMISIIRYGLKKTATPKRILIVGAGLAGLVSASLLKDAGHEVLILEANNRVGGRVYTMRAPFRDGLYLDMGAMRVPCIHTLTLEYIRRFALPLIPFINSTPNDIIYVNGIKTNRQTYNQHPDILQFPVAPWERGKTADQLMIIATQNVLDFIRINPARNWPFIIQHFSQYSMDFFLRHNPTGPSLSSGAVDMIKLFFGLEAFPELSFPEMLRFYILFSIKNMLFYEIPGGNDQLPRAFLPQLTDYILLKQEMSKIIHHANQVTIECVNPETSQATRFTGDLAILTLPFSALDRVEVIPQNTFSYYKWRAIRELHYVASSKIGIEFKERFWERQGMYGGQSITDLPIRFSYYPSHNLGKPGPAVMLASYTWEDASERWDSLSVEKRVEQSLENVAALFGQHITHLFATGTAFSWTQNPYSVGAFAIFKPEQETDLGPYLATPEGRIHFAGEHTSIEYHAWMQGAIESGIRVAMEVNQRRY